MMYMQQLKMRWTERQKLRIGVLDGAIIDKGDDMKKSIWILLVMSVIVVMANGCFHPSAAMEEVVENPVIFPQLGHSYNVNSVAFSPDGRYALSGSESLKLWDIENGKEIRTYAGHSDDVYSVAFSPDGRYALSGSSDKTLKLWDIESGRELRTFLGHTAGVGSVTFSPDGRYALSGSWNDTLKLWDIASGREIWTFTGQSIKNSSIAVFSSDGRFVLSSNGDTKLKLLDAESGKEIRTFMGRHREHVSSVAFSPDGRYALSGGESLKLWDVASGREIRIFTGHSDYVTSVAFCSDGKYALSGSRDKTLKLWDIVSGKEIRTFSGHSNWVESVTFSSDGRYALSGSQDRTLKLWDLASGKEIRAYTGYSSWIFSIAVSHDGKYALTGRTDKSLRLWDIANGREIQTFAGHSKAIESAAFSHNGKYALSGSRDKTLKLWDIASGKEVRTFIGHSNEITSVVFSPESRYILSGSRDKTLKLWDIANGKEIRTFTGHAAGVNSVTISPDGRYALSGSDDTTLKLWDIASGKIIQTFKGHSYPICSVAISPDGRYALSGSNDAALKFWDIASGKELQSFKGHSTSVRSVAISPDGRYALTGSQDNTLKLWDILSGKEIQTFAGHSHWVFSVAFSPDGRYVLSGSSDNTIRKWDTSNGKEIAQFISFTDSEWISITPEGYYNASPNGDKHLNVRIGNNVYGIENYREAFFRPDLVKVVLSGGSLKEMRNIANIKQPPKISIVQTPTTSKTEEAKVTLRLEEQGGGTGDVRLFLNGSAVVLDNGRGIKVEGNSNGGAVYRSYTLKLSKGLNTIRAIVFNADNTMQSNPVEHDITTTFASIRKPTLHALVIGIQEFKNPKLELKYSVADAVLFADTLQKGASELFEEVKITRLTSKEATTKEAIIASFKKYQSLNPDDLFVLYVASHGSVDDGEYFLITSNVGALSTQKLKNDALNQTELKGLVANIPSTKKMIIIDTCNAGKLGEAMQMAMMTRGMSEETAMKVLSRAVGSTILSASTSLQEALEGYKGHGLFTWALVEGMLGNADKGKSGFIKTTDLATYVEDEVPALAERVYKKAQYPTVSISGQGFPVGRVSR